MRKQRTERKWGQARTLQMPDLSVSPSPKGSTDFQNTACSYAPTSKTCEPTGAFHHSNHNTLGQALLLGAARPLPQSFSLPWTQPGLCLGCQHFLLWISALWTWLWIAFCLNDLWSVAKRTLSAKKCLFILEPLASMKFYPQQVWRPWDRYLRVDS